MCAGRLATERISTCTRFTREMCTKIEKGPMLCRDVYLKNNRAGVVVPPFPEKDHEGDVEKRPDNATSR